MRRDLIGALGEWIERRERQMGEVLIRPVSGRYELRHVADSDRSDLPVSTAAEEARQIALYSEEGRYRPLKTAPNLRRGWKLELGTIGEVRKALDYFYPAMLGVLLDFELGAVAPVTLRETLGRQSGMYAVTRKITDEQAQALIATVCRSDGGCLKTILWRISADVEVQSLPGTKFDPRLQQADPERAPALPVLCQEACNILVAHSREVVKAAPKV